MADFAEFVSNDLLYEQLKRLFDVSDKMKRFNELVRQYPEEFEFWCVRLNAEKCAEAESILAEYGIVEGEKFAFRRTDD